MLSADVSNCWQRRIRAICQALHFNSFFSLKCLHITGQNRKRAYSLTDFYNIILTRIFGGFFLMFLKQNHINICKPFFEKIVLCVFRAYTAQTGRSVFKNT